MIAKELIADQIIKTDDFISPIKKYCDSFFGNRDAYRGYNIDVHYEVILKLRCTSKLKELLNV